MIKIDKSIFTSTDRKLKIMDIIRYALAIIIAVTMIAVFLLLVKNDLKETFDN